jgi:amidase
VHRLSWGEAEFLVLEYEFKNDLNAYLSRLPASAPVRSLAGLIAFNEKNRNREMPWFEQEILQESQTRGPLTEKKYLDARKECLHMTREGIDGVMEKHKLDAMVTLTGGPAWYIDWVNGDTDTGSCSSAPAIAGYPHVTVPAGFFRGLPIGLSFFGRAWSEPVLLRLAYAFETAAKARKKPELRDA